jgi:hypothetical protein
MKRRTFLQTLGAAAVAAVVPAAGSARVLRSEDIAAAVSTMQQHGADFDYYYVVMHPSQLQDLKDIEARDKWATAWRTARKEGDRELPPNVILQKWGPW